MTRVEPLRNLSPLLPAPDASMREDFVILLGKRMTVGSFEFRTNDSMPPRTLNASLMLHAYVEEKHSNRFFSDRDYFFF